MSTTLCDNLAFFSRGITEGVKHVTNLHALFVGFSNEPHTLTVQDAACYINRRHGAVSGGRPVLIVLGGV